MLRGLFITGTGTGVGKTVVSAALMHRYRTAALCYWKPIQTGIETDDDTTTVQQLGGCSDSEVLHDGVRLPHPVSPHLAAELHHTSIRIPDITAHIANTSSSTRWIVEGAGGVLVPLNDSDLMIDLMIHLQLPVLVVSRTELGTINHTLLTLEALRARSLQAAGVVMVGMPNSSNRDAIEHYGKVPVLGTMPHIESLTANTVGAWASAELDISGQLRSYLQ